MSHLTLASSQATRSPRQGPQSRAHEIALRRIAEAGCERSGPEQIYCYHWGGDDLCWPCYAHVVLLGEETTPPCSPYVELDEPRLASGA